MTLGRGQKSLNFGYHVQLKGFIPNFVCVLTKILNRIFILLPGSCLGVGLGVLGESKTLAQGFTMAPHPLHALVTVTAQQLQCKSELAQCSE